MELNLGASTQIEVKAAETVTTQTVQVDYTVDTGSKVESLITFPNGAKKSLVLWDSSTTPTYTEIGDWTEVQKEARIIELLTA